MAFTNSAQAKASRLRSSRVFAGLTRKNLEEHGIPENTLRMWEDPREKGSGLTEKGAYRIVDALKKHGVICKIEWLLFGTGEGPKSYTEVSEQIVKPLQEIISVPDIDWGEDEIVLTELETFRNVNPSPVIFRISDDGMEPFLSNGDYVGGNKKYASEIEKYIGTICIVELTDSSLLCRRLEKGRSKLSNRYTLSCINPLTTVEHAILYDIEIHSIAKAVWIRKRDKIIR